MRNRVIGVLVVLSLAAGAFFLWNRGASDGGTGDENIRRATIEPGDLVVSVTATGSIVPNDELGLGFDIPGKVVSVLVEPGDSVIQGDDLAELDDSDLVFQVRQAEAGLAAAQAQLDQLQAGPREEEVAAAEASVAAAAANLEGTEANVRELESGAKEAEIAAAEANLDAAEASVWLSTVQRDQLTDGASGAEIAAAEANRASALTQQKIAFDAHEATMKCVTIKVPTMDGSKEEKTICPALGTPEEQARFNLAAADEALKAAQAQLDRLIAGPTQSEVDSGNANVAIAAAQRDAAQAQVDQLEAGASAEQLQSAQANVAAMEAQRDAAQAQLDLLRAGASVHQIAAAQASLDQAQVALEAAQAKVQKARLIAPFDAVVTAVNVKMGQNVAPTLPAITLADMSELDIVVDVDEIDVARLSEGQGVLISIDALPGEVVTGYVKRIAPAADQVGGVVVYEVTIVLEETDLSLRVGMSGTADIVIDELEDVLLVPNWAIRIDRGTGRTYVNLLREETVEEVEVEIGVRGEDQSQVLSGLDEGDVVVVGDVSGLQQFLE
jgi:HlyD family secretion protein